MKERFVFKTSIIVAAFFCLAPFVKAQPGPGGPDPDPANGVPLDGGLTMLVAAGIGYAAKKRYDDKRAKEKSEENLQK